MRKILLCAFVLLSSAMADDHLPADLTVQKRHGNAISYSGYRLGQSPQLNRYPFPEQLRVLYPELKPEGPKSPSYGPATAPRRTDEPGFRR